MDETLKVILIITSVGFIIFMVFILFIFININKAVNELKHHANKLIDEIVRSIKIIDADLNSLKDDISKSLSNFNQTSMQLTLTAKSLERGFNDISEITSRYKNLTNKINEIVIKPISSIALYTSAISKALSTFKDFMKKR